MRLPRPKLLSKTWAIDWDQALLRFFNRILRRLK